MIKKLFAKLISRRESGMDLGQRTRLDLGSQRFREQSTEESRLAAERQKARQRNMAEHREKEWVDVPLPTESQEKKDE